MPAYDHVREHLIAYTADQLSDAERQRVARNLAACPDCTAELRDWQALAGAVRDDTVVRAAPLPSLAPVLARIAQDPTPSSTRSASTQHEIGDAPQSELSAAGPGQSDGRDQRRGRVGLILLLFLLALLAWSNLDRGAAIDTVPVAAIPAAAPTVVTRQGSPGMLDRRPGVDGANGRAGVPAREVTGARIARLVGPEPEVGGDSRGGPARARLEPLPASSPFPPTRGATSVPVFIVIPLPSETPPRITAPPPDDTPKRVTDDPPPDDTAAPPPVDTPTPPGGMPTPTAGPGGGGGPAQGIAGQVLGPDGAGRAEIPIRARRPGAAHGDFVERLSAPDGGFALELGEGVWILSAESPDHPLAWSRGPGAGASPDPRAAVAIEVLTGRWTPGADFRLEARPAERVLGQVQGAADRPVAGALVIAEALEGGDTPAGAVLADDEGNYALHLAPGRYRLGASRAWFRPPELWWPAQADPSAAEPVTIGAGGPETRVDFRLP